MSSPVPTSPASRRALAVGAALVVAFVVLRLPLLWRFPPHTDESLFAYWAWVGYEDAGERFLPLSLGQNPMQEWMGMGLIRLGVEPLTALRLLSLLSGLVAMGAIAWIARRVAGDVAAVAAAAIWVVLPFSLVYGVVGVADPIIAALTIVAVALQMELVRTPRVDLALVLGMVIGVGALTKLTMMSAVWLAPLGALLFDWSREGPGRRVARWLGVLALAGLVAWLLYQVIRLSALWPGLPEAREHALARHSLGEFLDRPGFWIDLNWTYYRLALRGYLTIPIILAGAVGVGLVLRGAWRTGLFLLGWVLLPMAAVLALAGEPFVRWVLVSIQPFVVFAGVGAVWLVRAAARLALRFGPRAASAAAVVVVVALGLPSVVWAAHTIADPLWRPYPGRDDVDFVQAYSAGGPWDALVDQLERVPGPLRVSTIGNGLEYLLIALRREPITFELAAQRDPRALFAIQNTRDPLPAGPAPLAWRPVRVWQRPRDGLPATLSRRGVLVGSRFAATPEELRAALGSQEAVDALAADRPAVRAWLNAWRTAYPDG